MYLAAKLPYFFEFGEGVLIDDLARQMGDDVFFWPPFWERLRMTIANARTPDNPEFGSQTLTDQRKDSDAVSDELKHLFRYFLERGPRLRGRPSRIDNKALRLEYDALKPGQKPKWREGKATELGMSQATLRVHLSRGVTKR
jgi:hypothetical protein